MYPKCSWDNISCFYSLAITKVKKLPFAMPFEGVKYYRLESISTII